MAKDPHVHHGAPPETWLWDARPLENDSWGNIRGFDDGLSAGDFIDMRLWLRPEPRPLTNKPPIYRPAHAPLPPMYGDGGVRRCYRPTEEDMEIVKRVYPDVGNPAAPPWMRIEADLIAARRSREELVSMNAPALLRLAPLRARLHEIRAAVSAASDARRKLIKTCPYAAIKAEMKALTDRLNELRGQVAALRERGELVKRAERDEETADRLQAGIVPFANTAHIDRLREQAERHRKAGKDALAALATVQKEIAKLEREEAAIFERMTKP